MSEDREYLNHERRHLAQATRALSSVLENKNARALPLMDFYRAIVTYLTYNINRLCLQDRLLADTISSRFGDSDPELIPVLDGVYDRLNKHRESIADLLANMAAFELEGAAGQKQFEKAALAYLEARSHNRAKQNHSLAAWRDQVVTEDDWVLIASRTDAEEKAEQILFGRMIAGAPQGLDLFPDQSAEK